MSDPSQTESPTDASVDLAWRLRTTLRELGRRFAVAERTDLECCGMTVAQWATVEALALEGPTRSGRLAELLGVTSSTLSRNLVRLEQRGLVERVSDEDDGRVQHITLSRQGHIAARDVAEKEAAFTNAALGRLGADKAAIVVEALEDLLSELRSATQSCCGGAFDHYINTSFLPVDSTQSHSERQLALRGDNT